MHYHVFLRDTDGQISVVTGHHTYRKRATALAAARRLTGFRRYRCEGHGERVQLYHSNGDAVEVRMCENAACIAVGQ